MLRHHRSSASERLTRLQVQRSRIRRGVNVDTAVDDSRGFRAGRATHRAQRNPPLRASSLSPNVGMAVRRGSRPETARTAAHDPERPKHQDPTHQPLRSCLPRKGRKPVATTRSDPASTSRSRADHQIPDENALIAKPSRSALRGLLCGFGVNVDGGRRVRTHSRTAGCRAPTGGVTCVVDRHPGVVARVGRR